MRLLHLPATVLLCCTSLAQSALEFTIDQPASAWHWSGNTSVGPLLGNPSQDFNLADDFVMSIDAGALPIQSAAFVSGGSASVVPDLSGKIPNPIPGFPPLAIVDITGLKLEFTSPSFTLDALGNWTTDITVTALEGTLTVTPLLGSPTTTDLSGVSGDPTTLSGTLIQTGTALQLASHQSSTFNFTDPGSGITGNIDLAGDLIGDHACSAPVSYCQAAANSTGSPATIGWSGSTRIQDNAFTLTASQLPANKFGFFFMSEAETFVPNFGGGQGNLCVGSPQVRFGGDVLNSGAGGTVAFSPDLANLPQGTVFAPGDEWNFQLWYRDDNPGTTSNATDGLKVVWCP